MNQAITTTAPSPKGPDYGKIRQQLVNRIGEAGYLKSFKEHLETLPLTPEERFEEYYRVRESLKNRE